MRPYLLELFASLKAKTRDVVIVYIVRQESVFHAGKILDLLELALYIDFVLEAYLRLIPHWARERGALGVEGPESLVTQLRAAYEIGKGSAADDGSRAVILKIGV